MLRDKSPLGAPRGSIAKVEEYCARHGTYLLAFLYKLTGNIEDAQDLTQEVFLVAMDRLSRGEEVRNEKSWLSSIAVRLASNSRRSLWGRRVLGREHLPKDMVDWATPETALEYQEALGRFRSLLSLVSKKKRQVYVLHDLQGSSPQEIAEMLGCPVATVNSRLYHARAEVLELVRRRGDK